MIPIESLGNLRWYFLSLAVAFAAVFSVRLIPQRHQQPQSLDDVLHVAQDLRLFVRGDGPNGSVATRLILSETNPNATELFCLPVGHPHRAQNLGRVAVYMRYRDDTDLLRTQPENAAMWGRYFVYGDAGLIRRLLKHE